MYSVGSNSLSSSRLTSCEIKAYLTPRLTDNSSTTRSKKWSPWQVKRLVAIGAKYEKEGSSHSRSRRVSPGNSEVEWCGSVEIARELWWISRRLLSADADIETDSCAPVDVEEIAVAAIERARGRLAMADGRGEREDKERRCPSEVDRAEGRTDGS